MTEKDKLYADELRNKALADYERLNMAINELERQTCDTPRNNLAETSQDCIGRQEALKYSHIEYDDDGVGHRVIYAEDIEKLPPVTPSYNSIKTELKSCEDCVSREAVRKLIWQNNDKYGYSDRFHEFTAKCLLLPSVTPSIPDVENNFNLGYNCGYADAMSDAAESEEKE